jgi:hypothetical protein
MGNMGRETGDRRNVTFMRQMGRWNVSQPYSDISNRVFSSSNRRKPFGNVPCVPLFPK